MFKKHINPYSWIKADIFSLGVLLLNLVTNKYGFIFPKETDPSYKYIIPKKFELFWTSVKGNIGNKNLSEELKNLYFKMVSFNQKSRPSIEMILEDPWMKEINELKKTDKEKYYELKNELISKLLKFEDEIKKDDESIVTKAINKEVFYKAPVKGIADDDEHCFL